MLLLFSGLTVLCVFRLGRGPGGRPGVVIRVAALVYAAYAGWLLVVGVTRFGHLGIELGVVAALAAASYLIARRRGGRPVPG